MGIWDDGTKSAVPGLFHNLLSGGSEELLAEELEVEAEKTMAETVREEIAEIL